MTRLRYLIDLLKQDTSMPQKQSAMEGLFDACHMSAPNFRQCQNTICELEGVDILVKVAQESTDDEIIIWVFTVLGQMGFSNERSSTFLGSSAMLRQLVLDTLSCPTASARVKRNAIYALTNVVANAWNCHYSLKFLFPHLVRILETETDKDLCSQCVLILGNFAYNEGTRPALIDAGAIAPLARVMASGDHELLPTSAAVAIANLVGESEDLRPMLSLAHNHVLMDIVINAFKAALAGRDYPPASSIFYTDWKIALGLSNLAHDETNRSLMRRGGMVPLLQQALQKASDHSSQCDSRLASLSLKTLWLLSTPKAPGCPPTPPAIAHTTAALPDTPPSCGRYRVTSPSSSPSPLPLSFD